MPSVKPRAIDASHLEGGGQVVRIAVALAALTATPIRLDNIRANRSGGGGLKGQHLTAIKWLATACNAHVEGLELRSRTLIFVPGRGRISKKDKQALAQPGVTEDGRRAIRTGISLATNGATTLVLQTILPYLLLRSLLADSREAMPVLLSIEGGTNVPLSPSIDYFVHVFLPNLEKLGIRTSKMLSMKRGYTTGASTPLGSMTLLIEPMPASTIIAHQHLPFGPSQTPAELVSVHVHIMAPNAAANDELRAATLPLIEESFFPGLLSSKASSSAENATTSAQPRVKVTMESSADANGKRYYLLLVGIRSDGWRLGADWLYDGQGLRKKSTATAISREMATRVVRELKRSVDEGRAIDPWMEDQLVVFQALSASRQDLDGDEQARTDGHQESDAPERQKENAAKSSLHTQTARWVANELLGVKFDADGNCCNGIGAVAG